MIELREIDEDNFEECIYLKLNDEQNEYIASNAYSLSEAYASRNDKYNIAMPYAIYNDDVMVGFAMTHYQSIDPDDEDDDEEVFYFSRLMIDKRYQGNGYGKQAMLKMIEIMKAQPYGNADAIVLSVSKENIIAEKLYRTLGFVDTGEIDEAGDSYYRYELK